MSTESPKQTVFVVDDDEAFLDSLKTLCESVGLASQAFASALEFLEQYTPAWRGCLVLDVRMPRMSGLELQQELNQRGSTLPIVFVTGHGDIDMAVQAMKAGAVDFLTKPFSHQDLLDRIHSALDEATVDTDTVLVKREAKERLARLTPRESEVFDLVVAGNPNKIIANRLGISQRTVELHRAQVMTKMEADSLADLVRTAVTLDH